MWGWDRKTHLEDHRLASRGLQSDDSRWSRGTDFLPHPHTNNRFFFLLTTKYHILFLINMKKASKIPEITGKWRHFNIVMTSQINVRLFVLYLSLGLVWVCEIELSHSGKKQQKSRSCVRENQISWTDPNNDVLSTHCKSCPIKRVTLELTSHQKRGWDYCW